MSKDMRTIIIGAGGQGKIYAEILELNGYNIIGYVSSEPKGTVVDGYSVLCSIPELVSNNNEIGANNVIVAIGDNFARKKIIDDIKPLNLIHIDAIHPTAVISKYADIGNGVYIGAGTIINPGTIIRNYSSIGVNSSIGHDCIIDEYVNIAPGVSISGKVKFKEFSVAGVGAIVREKSIIGKNSIVGAGAVVINNIDDSTIVVGIPARFIKERDANKSYLK